MTYHETICEAMTMLGKHTKTCVIGYNTAFGLAGGSLKGFPADRLFEMPLAENLMCGAAVGMALDGWIPLIWLERFDFALCGSDAIINHLLKIGQLSEGLHKPAAIIRVAVGNSETPLFTGPTHCQNFSKAFREMGMEVIELEDKSFIDRTYRYALEEVLNGRSVMVVEFRDKYST